MIPPTPGRAPICWTCSPTRPGDLHMGHAEAYAIARRDGAVLLPPRVQRAAPDRLGRVRPARRERGHPQRHPPAPTGPTRTSRHRRPRSAGTRSPSTGRGGCRPATRSTTAGTSGCSCASTSGAWPTARTATSTGARWTRPCWPTSRSISGQCERCGSEVVRRPLTQWYFKITEYADRLLADMAPLEGNWPDRVLLMQRNWIGRSEGAEVRFPVEGRGRAGDGVHHPPRHAVRRDVLRRRRRLAAGRRSCARPSSVRRWPRTWPRCAS